MRITLVIGSLGSGGAEKVMSGLAGWWAERGHAVRLITLSVNEKDFYRLHPAVERVAMKREEGRRSLFGDAAAWPGRLLSLRAAITSSRPDVVIGFLDKANVVTLAVSRGLGIPVIVSERTVPSYYDIGPIWSYFRKVMYRRADAIVVQSEEAAEWVRDLKPSGRTKVVVIPNPVFEGERRGDSEPDSMEAAWPEGDTRKVAVAMGRLGREKGFDMLLQAFAQVAERQLDWRLVIIGEGDERGALERQAAELGLSETVSMPGRLKNPAAALRRADMFVLSSRFDGFPNALTEAMSCGLPAVVFACPGAARDIVRDGVDGLVAASGDTAALARAMERVMSDDDFRSALASRATDVAERFGMDKVMARWEELIADVVGGGEWKRCSS